MLEVMRNRRNRAESPSSPESETIGTGTTDRNAKIKILKHRGNEDAEGDGRSITDFGDHRDYARLRRFPDA